MSGGGISTSETKIEALKLQSSAYGTTVPWVMGVTRIPGNLVWYGGFKATPQTETQGGKGGVNVQSTSYLYTASVIMGLCHGPITGIPRIWRGKKLYTGDATPGLVVTASETYTPPGSGAMTFTVSHAAAWLGLLQVTQDITYDSSDGGTATGPEALARDLQYSISGAGVLTVLDNALRGVVLTVTYQWYNGTIVHNALTDLSLTFLSGEVGQAVWSGLATAPSAEQLGYSGLACVAGTDYSLGTGAEIENHNFEVIASGAYSLGSGVPDVDPSVAARDLLTNGRYGAGFPAAQLEPWTLWSNYCVATGILISPALTEQTQAADAVRTMADLTNTAPVWSGGRLRMVPFGDASATGNGRTFTPSITPVYDLDDECYVPAAGEAPMSISIKTPADRFNHVRIEYLNRANNYAVEIVEAKDQADIDLHGLRTMATVAAHWICDAASARMVAQLKLQRALAVCATYTIQLPWHFVLLEAGDLVTLTDNVLGMSRVPARITAIEESDSGELAVTMEECPLGMANAPVYNLQSGAGYQANFNAQPLSVQAPVFLEPPWEQAGSTGLAVWVAVTGQAADLNWGGCSIWVSSDGSNYQRAGQVDGGARYGTLRASITNASGTLPVQLSGKGGQILSGSASDAASDATELWIEGPTTGEFLTHTTATLIATNSYDLTVQRATHSTVAAAAASGTNWVRVDSALFKEQDLSADLVGKTFHVKFTSYNLYGFAEQSLAAATDYTYTIRGEMLALKPNTLGGTLRLTTDRFPYFSFADGTTHTAQAPGDSDITFTAQLFGLFGTATFTAEAFNSSSASLGTFVLGGSGNARTMTAAQFVSLGTSGSVRTVVVTATLGSATDSLTVYRQDSTTTAPRIYLDNPVAAVPTDEAGEHGDYSGAATGVLVYAGVTDVTSTYTFAITPDSGITSTINGLAGPVSGTGSVAVAVSDSTIDDGAVLITTSGPGVLTATFRVTKAKASGAAYTAYFTPDEIRLPVNVDGSVATYAGASSLFTIMKAALDDTAQWTLAKADTNVASTLTGRTVAITNFYDLGQTGTTTSAALVNATGWTRGQSLLWGGGAWLTLGYNGGSTLQRVKRSLDFATWTDINTGTAGNWEFGAYGSDRFILPDWRNSSAYIESLDGGLTWTVRSFGVSRQWTSIAYGAGRWIVGAVGTSTARTSTNSGSGWTDITLPASQEWITYAGSRWVMKDASVGLLYTSTNGTSWSSSVSALSGCVMARGVAGRSVALFNGGSTAKYCDNGTTWVSVTLPQSYSVAYAEVIRGVLYLVGTDGKVQHTTDGSNWVYAGGSASISYSYGGMHDLCIDIDDDILGVLETTSGLHSKTPLLSTSADTGFVSITATKPNAADIVLSLPVRKGLAPADVYTSQASPASVLLPSTKDGVVTDYTPGVVVAQINKNGVDDTANWSISWTTTNLTPSSGTGATVTLTAMTDGILSGSIFFTAAKAGQPLITGTVGVFKSYGAENSGPRIGAAFNAITATATFIGLKFLGDGRFQIKVGSGGSYVDAGQWAGAIRSSNASTYWIRVQQSGATLTSGTTGSWLAMTSDREYTLSDATSGIHRTDLQVLIGTSSSGANAVLASGALQLVVP